MEAEAPGQQPRAAPGEGAARTLVRIGARLRAVRQARAMTLQDLGRAAGISPSMLSLVERGLAAPSIGSLIVLCEVLGTTMSALVDGEGAEARGTVTRAADAHVVATGAGAVRRVMREDTARGVAVAVNEYAPGAASSDSPVQHGGFEYGLVLEGRLTVEVGAERHLLEAGDLIAYPSDRPHRIWNHGEEVARTVWFNTRRG